MFLKRHLIIIAALLTIIPVEMKAQRRFEINVGISTPGMHAWEKTNLDFGEAVDLYDEYESKALTGLDKEAYKSRYYPGYSLEVAYRLQGSGFVNRLSLVGYLGLNMVSFSKYDIVSNKSMYDETAVKFDFLAGARVDYFSQRWFDAYGQILLGGYFRDKSQYWNLNPNTRNGSTTVQATFIGLRFNPGEGRHLTFATEFGVGSEYTLGELFIVPGVRVALVYYF